MAPPDQVDVDRVRVLGEVVDLPHLDVTRIGHALGRRRVPGQGRARAVGGDRAEQRLDGPEGERARRPGRDLEDADDVALAVDLVEDEDAFGVRLVERHPARRHRVAEPRQPRQREQLGRRRPVAARGVLQTELHDLAGRARVRRLEVDPRHPAAERLVGSDVDEIEARAGRHGHGAEVDDDVRTLRRAEQQLVELHRCGEEALLGADLPEGAADLAPGRAVVGIARRDETEDEEARIRAVQEAQPVATPLDVEVRPGAPVHHDRVAEELGVPDRRDVARRPGERALGDERDLQLAHVEAFEERPVVRVEEGAVGVERAVLDGER
ncbi:MAG: hypothetical protein AB1689_03175, partial [Thermodesulfobacteriota bacterium]